MAQPTLEKSFCCNESAIICNIRQDHDCVTQARQFINLCEDVESLKFSRYLFAQQIKDTKQKNDYLKKELDNALLRHLAYNTFDNLVNCNQLMGRWNKITLPSCVVNRVRGLYPDPHGKYHGFMVAESGTVQTAECRHIKKCDMRNDLQTSYKSFISSL